MNIQASIDQVRIGNSDGMTLQMKEQPILSFLEADPRIQRMQTALTHRGAGDTVERL
jgi:hypothetical protein